MLGNNRIGGDNTDPNYARLNRGGLISYIDDAIDQGFITVKKYVKEGDGEYQVEETGDNEYLLHDYDGTTKSGGIKVENVSRDRFFLFELETENQNYFQGAFQGLSSFGSNSVIKFILGPRCRFEIDIDSEYKNLDVCYIQAAYRTGVISPSGEIQYARYGLDFNQRINDEVYVKFKGEVTRADLPLKENAFVSAVEGGVVDFLEEEIGGRFIGYDEGRGLTRTNPYNTVKVKVIPGIPLPVLVRELLPGFPTEYGFTRSEGSIGQGEATPIFPGDNPGEVLSITQNVPSFLYPFNKEDGSRYTVMDLAESSTPDFLKAGGVLERASGNTVDRLGDLPYFRYWGDFVLLTPMVIAAVGTGIVLWFSAPAILPIIKTTVVPMAKQTGNAVLAIPKGLWNGSLTVAKSVGELPKAFRETYSD
tara:strand:- start:2370 stop:3629 length:1260 start_codon:yes stop_codon:yes gene_type:complete